MRRKKSLMPLFMLGVTLSSLIGAWSFSRATVVSGSSFMITKSPDALLSLPEFGSAPVIVVPRNATRTYTFPITNRSLNDVNVALQLISAPARMSVTLAPSGAFVPGATTIEAVMTITTRNNTQIGLHQIQVRVLANGTGYSARADATIVIQVANIK